jgi:hypothetical protein
MTPVAVRPCAAVVRCDEAVGRHPRQASRTWPVVRWPPMYRASSLGIQPLRAHEIEPGLGTAVVVMVSPVVVVTSKLFAPPVAIRVPGGCRTVAAKMVLMRSHRRGCLPYHLWRNSRWPARSGLRGLSADCAGAIHGGLRPGELDEPARKPRLRAGWMPLRPDVIARQRTTRSTSSRRPISSRAQSRILPPRIGGCAAKTRSAQPRTALDSAMTSALSRPQSPPHGPSSR